jgi:hypothetical protein
MLKDLVFSRLLVGQQSKAKVKLSVPNIKVWSTFSKVAGLGRAHKSFLYSLLAGANSVLFAC